MNTVTVQIKNDLLLRALSGNEVPRPPVWMMRQAGRYLPDYRKLRDKYSFFERCENPDLVSEITIMPIDQIGTDAAILFSDILVVPKAMGFNVEIIPGKGPILHKAVQSIKDVEEIEQIDVHDRLAYVLQGIQTTKKDLDGRVPLLGFAGAPWTILCYMIEGKGSKNFAQAKAFCYEQPDAAKMLLQKITDITIDYLNAQIEAGVDGFQVFDSWAGMLSPADFNMLSFPYMQQIVDKVKGAPSIIFAKGCWYAMKQLADSGANGIGIDWTMDPKFVREQTGSEVTLQGNLDPGCLLAPIPAIKEITRKMLNDFGKSRYIANLGHGILPNVPVDHAKAFVDTVKQYENS